jgi:hypothetical protein
MEYLSKEKSVKMSGTKLAYALRGLSAQQRAIIGAWLVQGVIELSGFTQEQTAAICVCSDTYISEACHLTMEAQKAVFSRQRPLIDPLRSLEKQIRRVGTEPAFDTLCKTL